MLSRICKHGRLRLGNGANQSVRTFKILCSIKANCKSFFINCDMTGFSIAIFLVAGFCCLFSSRSSCECSHEKHQQQFELLKKTRYYFILSQKHYLSCHSHILDKLINNVIIIIYNINITSFATFCAIFTFSSQHCFEIVYEITISVIKIFYSIELFLHVDLHNSFFDEPFITLIGIDPFV